MTSGNLNNISNMLVNANISLYGIYLSNSSRITLSNIGFLNNNGNFGIILSACSKVRCDLIRECCGNGAAGISYSYDVGSVISEISKINNNGSYGVNASYSSGSRLRKSEIYDNGSYGIILQGGEFIAEESITTQSMLANLAYNNQRIYLHNLNRYAGNHQIVTDYGLINVDTINRHTESGVCWRFQITGNNRNISYPLDLRLAKVWCQANVAVTVKAWVKKSHATAIGAALVCRGGQIAGVSSDVVATKANNTNYEQLSITFTPTVSGLVDVEAWSWYISGGFGQSVYFDDLELPTGVDTQTLDYSDAAQPWAQNAPAGTGGGGSPVTRAWAHVGI